MKAVDLVSSFTSPTVLQLSGTSPSAGVTAVLLILMPGVLRMSNCNFVEIIYKARHLMSLVSRRTVSEFGNLY